MDCFEIVKIKSLVNKGKIKLNDEIEVLKTDYVGDSAPYEVVTTELLNCMDDEGDVLLESNICDYDSLDSKNWLFSDEYILLGV